jgi:hypothetical protein
MRDIIRQHVNDGSSQEREETGAAKPVVKGRFFFDQ